MRRIRPFTAALFAATNSRLCSTPTTDLKWSLDVVSPGSKPAAPGATSSSPPPSTSPVVPAAGATRSFTNTELLTILSPHLPTATEPVVSVERIAKRLSAPALRQLRQHPQGLYGFLEAHLPVRDFQVLREEGTVQLKQRDVAGVTPSTASPPRTTTPNTTVSKVVPNATNTAAPPPPAAVMATASKPTDSPGASVAARGYRTPAEVLDVLIPFIPTFFVDVRTVEEALPKEMHDAFGGLPFIQFLKKYRFYLDLRTAHAQTEVRLRADVSHPKRGAADLRYSAGVTSSDVHVHMNRNHVVKKPPRNSEANLILYLIPQIPATFTPMGDVLQEVSSIVSKHPSYDARLGVSGLFEKYPEYFQMVDGKIRVRPFECAPNSIDSKGLQDSPNAEVFAKVVGALPAAPDSPENLWDSYAETVKLFSLLTPAEKQTIKSTCKSFTRFLRMHGKVVVVSQDNLRVRRFVPELEKCADTMAKQAAPVADTVKADDPVLQVPAKMAETSTAGWAVKEFYDALPLMQAAELDDVLMLVPQSVRVALPADPAELLQLLSNHPDYFTCWSYPDDPAVTVVQRAKLVTKDDFTEDELLRSLLHLIPQGGIPVDRLLRKVPLPIQRYVYKFGMKATAAKLKSHIMLVDKTVLRIG